MAVITQNTQKPVSIVVPQIKCEVYAHVQTAIFQCHS